MTQEQQIGIDDRLSAEVRLLVQYLEVYLERPSNDGRMDRAEMRAQLKKNIASVKQQLGDTE